MKVFYDLHIHSCLSPCARNDMTPANIAGMASLKGLSLIALTDHNCGRNLHAMAAAAQHYGLIFVPGIEVNSSEEVHVLVYFADTDQAVAFGEKMYSSLPDISNKPEIFGRQIAMDAQEGAVSEPSKLLLQATAYPLDTLVQLAWQQGGCAVPAHINRPSFSIFSNIGFMPPGLFRCVEVCRSLPCPPLDPGLCVLHSSDAHQLGDIQEPHTYLMGIQSARDFIQYIRRL